MMDLVLFGPPGAGKGTQGVLLAEKLQLRRLSTGDLLREAVREGTELGREARRYMDAGELVPDQVILGLVRQYLEVGVGGVIFDGFPRTEPQARALDALLAELGRSIQAVLVLDVPDDVLVRRISGRRSCPACGAVYHVDFDPPAEPGRCDRCGADLVHRADDEETTVRRRLAVYRAQTAPLLAHYQASPGTRVEAVAGDLPIEQVQQNLIEVLSQHSAEIP